MNRELKVLDGQPVMGDNGFRISWTKEDYVDRIKLQMTSSLYSICVMFKELKEKFFEGEDDSGQTWTKFCKDEIGISRHAVAGYLRIGKYVLPRISQELANKLGVRKLLVLAKLGENADWDKVLDELHEEIELKNIKKLADKYGGDDESTIKVKPSRKAFTTLRKNIETLDEDLRAYLPNPNDFESKQKFKEIANQLYNSMDSLMNMIRMLMKGADE